MFVLDVEKTLIASTLVTPTYGWHRGAVTSETEGSHHASLFACAGFFWVSN